VRAAILERDCRAVLQPTEDNGLTQNDAPERIAPDLAVIGRDVPIVSEEHRMSSVQSPGDAHQQRRIRAHRSFTLALSRLALKGGSITVSAITDGNSQGRMAHASIHLVAACLPHCDRGGGAVPGPA